MVRFTGLVRGVVCALVLMMAAGWATAAEPEIPLRTLTVTPAAAPAPALKYHLLPELRDTTPGNAVLLYYRAFAPEWSRQVRSNKELDEKLNAASDKSPAEVKAMPETQFLRDWGMLKEVDRASRRANCDWELTPRLREDGVALLIPDLQGLREFARFLKLRVKLELADGQFDKAVYTLQTGLQLGQHAAHGPTLIQGLVGAAITAVMLNEVEEWIGTPRSPNLYWALTALPQPFVDLRMGFQGEKIMLDNLLPGFRDGLANGHMPPVPLDRLNEIVSKLSQVAGESQAPTWVIFALVAKNYGSAKDYLEERGWPAAQVEKLPAVQVVLLHETATNDRLYDEMLKWQGQPYAIARPGLDRADRELRGEVARTGRQSLASMLLPAVSKVYTSQARTDRTINFLRTIEALRLYAAAHGKLPAKLADITEVPIPIDPFTGQPFEYRLDGDKALLTAPPTAGEQPVVSGARRYEIMLAK